MHASGHMLFAAGQEALRKAREETNRYEYSDFDPGDLDEERWPFDDLLVILHELTKQAEQGRAHLHVYDWETGFCSCGKDGNI